MGNIDKDMNARFADEKHRVGSNILFTANWIKHRFEAFIKPYGLTSPQFNILRILRGAGDWLNMHEVRQRMVEKSPNATRLCDKLLDKQLIERSRGEQDRRAVYLKISDQGLKLLAEVDEKDKGPDMKFMDNISDKEARLVSDILDKLRG